MAFNCLDPDQAVKVEVSYIEPEFAASYLDAAAFVSYVEPSFTASYIEVNICAAVTFPDVLSVDIVTPTDLVTLDTTKALGDTTDGFIDNAVKGFTKNLFDFQSLADLAVIGDIQPHVDNVDTSSPLDSISTVAFEKYVTDTFGLLDSLVATKVYQRSFSDSFSLPDVPYKSVVPGQKLDTAAVLDVAYRGVDKTVADSLSLIDNMDGDIEYLFFKTVNDLVAQADAQAVDFASNKSDNAILSSSGSLLMQDYCDITYFLEDYVGASRTFT